MDKMMSEQEGEETLFGWLKENRVKGRCLDGEGEEEKNGEWARKKGREDTMRRGGRRVKTWR